VDRTPTVFQDLQSGLVVPVMDNALQHVRVCSGGNAFEEISADDFAALAYWLLPQGGRPSDHGGQIVQNTAQARVRREDSDKKQAMASAHINDSFKLGEIVRTDDGSNVSRRGTHRGVEYSGILRMPGQVLEEWGAVYAFERRLSGPNRML
jgi:hypothetical protein